MNATQPLLPVVVGIDGSKTAILAAQWAIDEAASRSVPLRLVYVTKPTHPSADDYYEDIRHAEASLRAAQAAVEAAGKPVKVETAILNGLPGLVLVEESRGAGMICVGPIGIGRYRGQYWVRRPLISGEGALPVAASVAGRTTASRDQLGCRSGQRTARQRSRCRGCDPGGEATPGPRTRPGRWPKPRRQSR